MNTNDVMTKNVVTVSPDHGVRHAATIMLVNHVSGLPVIDDEGRLVGLISEGDLLRRVELGLGAIARSAEQAHSAEERARAYETAAGDKAIRRSIVTRLNEQTGLEGKAVTVTVADGLVHLWGNVDTDDCRNAARVVAESVRGVRGVVQHFPQEEPDSRRDGG